MTAKVTGAVIVLGILAAIGAGCPGQPEVQETTDAQDEVYDPQIDPADFTTEITGNKYLVLTPGTKLVYEGEVEDGFERNEVVITDDTKTVMGVETRVYWDRVWLDGELIEDTKDWLAQDSEGNVWYFGEDVDNFEDGELADHEGAWEAGVDGAKPGIWLKADPKVGDSYRQEYYEGEAEDIEDIVAIGAGVVTPYGTFEDCVKTLDYTPLEPDVEENKYYCSEVGGMVLEENPGTGEKLELIAVEKVTDDK